MYEMETFAIQETLEDRRIPNINVIKPGIFPNIISSMINIRVTEQNYNKTKAKLNDIRDLLYKWIDETELTIQELNDLADDLDVHFKRISKVKIGGSAVAIGGGILAAVGFGLSFATFGTSLVLSIAGGAIAGVGGGAASGSMVVDAVLSKKRRNSTEQVLKKCQTLVEEIKEMLQEINVELSNYGCMDNSFPEWRKFWAPLLFDAAGFTKNVCWDITTRNINTGLRFVSYADDVARVGSESAATAFKTLGTVGRTFHIIGGVTGLLFLPLDIYTLVDSAIDVHKKNPHKVSASIRGTANKLLEECPKKKSVDKMIEETMKIIDDKR